MPDSVDVVECSRDAGSIEDTIQGWLDDNNPSSLDFIRDHKIGSNRIAIAFVYTSA